MTSRTDQLRRRCDALVQTLGITLAELGWDIALALVENSEQHGCFDASLYELIELQCAEREEQAKLSAFAQPPETCGLADGAHDILRTHSGMPITISVRPGAPNRLLHLCVSGPPEVGKSCFLGRLASKLVSDCCTLVLASN